VLPVITAALLIVVSFVVSSALGVLAGSPSKFEANDGNMIVNTSGDSDWNSVQSSPNYVHISDLFSSTSDDSFQPGQKQDSPCPVIASNKNPPKDDFTDVASFNETNFDSASPQFHHTFLNGATIRVAANGNASENVELNKGTNGICAGTTAQLERSAGDKLIAIDYLNGGTNVAFHVLTWVISGTCFVKTDSVPCWGSDVQSLSANAAEGLVNQSPIAASDNKINNLALVTGQFAEFGVDLTAAGIIPANTCQAFPQTVWESRASGSSFVSSTEDVSVEHHAIANCGTLIVKKVTDPSPDPTGTTFTFTKTSSSDGVNRTFGLANGGSDSETVFAASDFSVTESVPSNWTLASATCDNGSGTRSGSTLSGITVGVGQTVTCTFTDKLELGAIKITKTSSKASAAPLAGATFSITGPNSYSKSVTTGSDGTVCVGDLALGTYSVQETAAPAGYSIDDASAHSVTVSNGSTCGDGNEATFVATDTPLTDVSVTATSEVAGGTQSTITCVDSGNAGVGNSPQGPADPVTVAAKGLKPGTYSCTIVIDP
jgi:hypothetical protein